MEQSLTNKYDESVAKITSCFENYSFKDIYESIFVSDLWIPNISSPVKHLLLYSILLSIPEEKLSKQDCIKSYQDFQNFIDKIYSFTPSFVFLEDYVPETDWGEVKFHFMGKNYKILYGADLLNVYDYLTLFEITYVPLDSLYSELTNRSPKGELITWLSLHNDLITNISFQKPNLKQDEIALGNLNNPTESFWSEIRNYLQRFNPFKHTDINVLNHYYMDMGSFSQNAPNEETFIEAFQQGELLKAAFIKHQGKYYPVSPRRWFSVLIDKWAEIYSDNKSVLDEKLNNNYSNIIGDKIFEYFRNRFYSKNIFRNISVVAEDNKVNEMVFSASFISKNRIFLIHILKPLTSGEEIQSTLDSTISKIRDALNLLSNNSLKIFHHPSNQIIQYKNNGKQLEPYSIIVVPNLNTCLLFTYEDLSNIKVLVLDQFLGLVDEIKDIDEFSLFLEFLDKYDSKMPSIVSLLDKYGAFKGFNGVIESGATKFDYVFVDPHWGSYLRYDTLAKFWKEWPNINTVDDPRRWKIDKKGNEILRLTARGFFDSILFTKIANTRLIIMCPFDEIDKEYIQIAVILTSALADCLETKKDIFNKHEFLGNYQKIEIYLVPESLVAKNEDYKCFRSMKLNGNRWLSENKLGRNQSLLITLVYNEAKVKDALMKATDSSFEVEILIEILQNLNKVHTNEKWGEIAKCLESTKSLKPRWGVSEYKLEVSFENNVPFITLEDYDYKYAATLIADIAKAKGISPGTYYGTDAKNKLNAIRDLLISKIAEEIIKYDFNEVIVLLLCQIEALDHKELVDRLTAVESLKYDTEYELDNERPREYAKFNSTLRKMMYFIEKVVYLQPNGKNVFDVDRYKEILAMISNLDNIYTASDYIYYGIEILSLSIDDDFKVSINYPQDFEAKILNYYNFEQQLKLNLIGEQEARFEIIPSGDLKCELDEAFIKDFGVSIQSLCALLAMVSLWPEYSSRATRNSYYKATIQDISECAVKNIKNTSDREVEAIINFLTLRPDKINQILGQNEPANDVPVWEHLKRPERYNLKPLVRLNEDIIWGPYSARRAAKIWAGAISFGKLPADFDAPNMMKIISREKNRLEKGIEDKAFEIAVKHTNTLEKNLFLHKRDKKSIHPDNLGDFDVLAYLPKINTVLNIECKDLLQVFCAKDGKRLKEEIFGDDKNDSGYLEKIEKRHKYLEEHSDSVFDTLKWKLGANSHCKIVSIYLSQRTYWWMFNLPRATDVKFVRIELLNDFIRSLN